MQRMVLLILIALGVLGIVWIGAFVFMWANDPTPQVTIDSSNTINPDTNEVVLPDPVPTSDRKLYALGDSLTAGYRLPLEDSYPSQLELLLQDEWYDITVINWWRSWDTSAQLLSRMDRLLEDAQAWDLAIIVIGANDGFQSLPLTQLEQNIEKMISMLEEKGVEVIIWGMQIPTNLSPEYRNDFAAIYPRLADQYDLPLIPFFLENVAAVPSLNLSDGIHPTAEWYGIIAEQIKEFLEENELISK